jgi:CRP/FNR family transcriptional regulator, cyclic AMP receptor protein
MNDFPSGQRTASLSPQSLEALFSQHGWLSEASGNLRARLLADGNQLYFARGERVFAGGDSAGGIYGVVSGGIGLEASARGHPMRMGHVVWTCNGFAPVT